METWFKFIHFIENLIGLYEFKSFFCFEKNCDYNVYKCIYIIATSRKDISSSIEDIEVHQIVSVKWKQVGNLQ